VGQKLKRIEMALQVEPQVQTGEVEAPVCSRIGRSLSFKILTPKSVPPSIQPFPLSQNSSEDIALEGEGFENAAIKPSASIPTTLPEAATRLLQELERGLEQHQFELQQVLHDIELLYREGPVINGWLKSMPVESLEGDDATLKPPVQYQLFGLDTQGQPWSHPCQAEQVPSISLAIARHQKLRQLLNRQQFLENWFAHLRNSLLVLREHLVTPYEECLR
jgi:hypothetical protein